MSRRVNGPVVWLKEDLFRFLLPRSFVVVSSTSLRPKPTRSEGGEARDISSHAPKRNDVDSLHIGDSNLGLSVKSIAALFWNGNKSCTPSLSPALSMHEWVTKAKQFFSMPELHARLYYTALQMHLSATTFSPCLTCATLALFLFCHLIYFKRHQQPDEAFPLVHSSGFPLEGENEFLTFFFIYLRDLLCIIAHESGIVNVDEFDSLSLLFSSASSLGSQQFSRLSDSVSFWDNERGCSSDQLHRWLQQNLTVNNLLYPSQQTLRTLHSCGPLSRSGPFLVNRISNNTVYITTEHSTAAPSRCAYITCNNTSSIYVLSALAQVFIADCNNCIVVVGAVSGSILMRQCAKVTLIATCKTLRVVNCNDCKLFICTNNRPLMLGSNLQIGLAPYNTTYPTLIHHLRQSRININNNFWDKPFIVSDTRFCAQQPSVYLLPTAEYSRFCIPFDFTDAGNTERATLVVPLPSAYSEALHQEEEQANEAIQRIMQMEEMSADSTRHIQKCFQEWLAQSRKLREICDLCHLESTPNQPNTSDS